MVNLLAEPAVFVRQALAHAGISQAELARRTGVSEPTVSQWVKGTRTPSMASMKKIADACGMSLQLTVEEDPAA